MRWTDRGTTASAAVVKIQRAAVPAYCYSTGPCLTLAGDTAYILHTQAKAATAAPASHQFTRLKQQGQLGGQRSNISARTASPSLIGGMSSCLLYPVIPANIVLYKSQTVRAWVIWMNVYVNKIIAT